MVQRWLRASGYRRHLRAQHHRHRRQDHQACNGERRVDPCADRPLYRLHERGRSGARRAEAGSSSRAPRSTWPQMLRMIGDLEQQRHRLSPATAMSTMRCAKFPGYGKLSGKSLDDLRAGERVEVDASKRDPLDFVLWKHAKADEPARRVGFALGQRPAGLAHRVLGHELRSCSATTSTSTAAARTCSFPHHENEIAQSEGAPRRHLRELLDAQRLRARGRREDVQVARQFLHHPRHPARSTTPRWCASSSCAPTTAARSTTPTPHLEDAKQALTRLYTALKNVPPGAAARHRLG